MSMRHACCWAVLRLGNNIETRSEVPEYHVRPISLDSECT